MCHTETPHPASFLYQTICTNIADIYEFSSHIMIFIHLKKNAPRWPQLTTDICPHECLFNLGSRLWFSMSMRLWRASSIFLCSRPIPSFPAVDLKLGMQVPHRSLRSLSILGHDLDFQGRWGHTSQILFLSHISKDFRAKHLKIDL